MKTIREKKHLLYILLGLVLVLLILMVILLIRHGKAQSAEAKEIKKGISYLKEEEARDPSYVQQTLSARAKAKRAAEYEENLSKIMSGEIDVWTLFDDIIILGDSRAFDFVYNGFLPESRVMNQIGVSVTAAPDHLQEVINQNPSILIFTYGENDADNSDWSDPQVVAANYEKSVEIYHEALPDADIYVSSVLPVSDEELDRHPWLSVIPDINEALKAMCDKHDYLCYIDCDVLGDLSEYYGSDGVHFYGKFYPIWARTLIKGVYDNEFRRSEAETGAADGGTGSDSAAENSAAPADGTADLETGNAG